MTDYGLRGSFLAIIAERNHMIDELRAQLHGRNENVAAVLTIQEQLNARIAYLESALEKIASETAATWVSDVARAAIRGDWDGR
jgi:hypothetical protein